MDRITFLDVSYFLINSSLPQLPADIEWHFIGHLQSNKVKSLLGNLLTWVNFLFVFNVFLLWIISSTNKANSFIVNYLGLGYVFGDHS